MAVYSLAQRTTQGTAANASWEIIAAASNKPNILLLESTQVAATAGVFGLGRPAATGITPTSPQTFVDEGDGNAATALTTAAVAWGTGPTVPANFNRRIACAATIGVGYSIIFPGGFRLPVSKSLVIWIIATSPACDVHAVVSE